MDKASPRYSRRAAGSMIAGSRARQARPESVGMAEGAARRLGGMAGEQERMPFEKSDKMEGE